MAEKLELEESANSLMIKAEGTEAIAVAERLYKSRQQDRHRLSWGRVIEWFAVLPRLPWIIIQIIALLTLK